MTEMLEAMTKPDVNGTPDLPKRAGPKGLLPSTWLERGLTERAISSEATG